MIPAREGFEIFSVNEYPATDTAHRQLLCGDQILDGSQAYTQAVSAFTLAE
jgi:hypothetical protein